MTEHVRIARDDRENFCNPYAPEVENYFYDNIPSPILDSLEECLKENEKYKDETFLTNLVRETYVRYLKNCLTSNYKSWLVATGGGMELTDKVLTRCAHVMERTALRQCMIASLYRRAISEIISNVKKSTDRWKLHEDLLGALNWSSSVRDAWTQSECNEKNANTVKLVTIACQTEDSPETLRAAPDSTGELVISSCKAVKKKLSTANATKSSPKNKKSSLPSVTQDKCLKESSSLSIPAAVPQPVPPLDSVVYGLHTKSALPLPPLLSSDDLFGDDTSIQLPVPRASGAPTVSSNTEEKVLKKRKSEPSLNESIKRRKFSLPCEPKKKPLEECLKKPLEERLKKPLEERLKKFEDLFGDSDLSEDKNSSINKSMEVPPVSSPGKLASELETCRRFAKYFILTNWKLDAVAQTCQLNKLLGGFTQTRRKALLKKFENLFGMDGTEARFRIQEQRGLMLPEEFSQCRQRAASLVVSELTNFYDHKRISSRVVFKAMAQEMTSIILTETFAPDLDLTKKYVERAFANDAKYSTVEDVASVAPLFK